MIINVVITLGFAITALAQNGLTVSTHQGNVVGTLVTPTVRQFLGIPYAVANRWEAPQLPPNRSQPLNANSFSDSCPQASTNFFIEFQRQTGLKNTEIFPPQSEQCLTVNIWAPATSRKQQTAVMLWVHGGAFLVGSSRIAFYNGKNIVRDNDDVIVVSFNYRLNIFGFPGAPPLSSTTQSQNFGLLDIDAAVQWVYDNIAAFGGDRERIVLFGESAGGIAIDAYTFAHPQDTRVKGVIQQSGSVDLITDSFHPLDPTAWTAVANIVGCGSATGPAQLSCMKQVSLEQLEDTVISINGNFVPIVDGITTFSDTVSRSASGNFLHVPLLGGTNQHEGDIVLVSSQIALTNEVIPNLTELLSDLLTQISFTCVFSQTSADRVKASVPTWRYQYQAVFRDISRRPDLRAFHTAEIPFVFGTYDQVPTPAPTNDEINLSKYIQRAWVAFARNPTNGLTSYGWPRYSPTTQTLAQLGNFFNQTGSVFTKGQLIDFTCNSFQTLVSVNEDLTALLPHPA